MQERSTRPVAAAAPAITTSEAEWRALAAAVPREALQSVGPADAAVVAVAAGTRGGVRAGAEGGFLGGRAVDALTKAFDALGLAWSSVRVVPAIRGRAAPALGWARLLAWEVEIVDPVCVLVLGDDAAAVAREAWPQRIIAGGATAPWSASGRPIVVLPDPEEALGDEAGKRALWDAVRRAAPLLAGAKDG